jgi:hypothetical protein
MALIATGTAAISIVLAAVPAAADQVRQREWWLTSLSVTSAWSASQGAGVTVAVLSDGVNARTADLAGAVTAASAIPGAPVATGQYFGEQGTPIASLIAGRGHGPSGSAGVVGVAPKARILSVPVTVPPDDPKLSQSSVAASVPGAIAAGIRYAVNHGATVIDLPIDPGQASSAGTAGASAAAGGSAAEQAAVGYALAHNVVLVAPAGDDEMAGDAANYPAAYRGVIAVGAFDSAFNKAPFSSHHSYVTLTAAGVGVLAASSTTGYVTMNSTSAASAVVAGAVALMRARYPSLTVAEVRQALITSTTYRRAGGLAVGSGYGALNAARAMKAAAALGTPPAARASAGAQPVQPPAAVSAPSAAQGMGTQIVRAAEVSGGVLLVLLLLIAAYAASGRRRRPRRQPAVAAEWTHRHAQSRYPQPGNADADRMLEVFAAPPSAPAARAAAPLGRYPALPAAQGTWQDRAHDGVFAPTAGPPPVGALGSLGTAGPALSGSTPPSGAGDEGGWLTHSPASRAVSGRATVSGAPPWEPAVPPDDDLPLPWTAAPGGHSTNPDTDAPDAAAAPAPAWFATAQQIWLDAETEQSAPLPTRTNGGQPAGRQPSREPAAPAIGQSWQDRPRHAAQSGREMPTAAFGSAADRGSAPPSGSPAGSPAGSRTPGFQSPAGSARGGFDSPARHGSTGGFAPTARHGSPTSFGSPEGRGATDDLGYGPPTASPGGHGGDDDVPPRLAASGLPVRQPRAALPTGPAPLSPSGSLFEPVSNEARTEAADRGSEDRDAAGRPIFVWNAGTNEPPSARRGEPGSHGSEYGWRG